MGFLLKLLGKRNYTTINGSQLNQILNNGDVLILDVRNPDEFKSGHIPNAINIPVDRLASKLSTLNSYKNSEILVYCASGGRSSKAANILSKRGFSKVYNLSGGISSYKGKLNRK